VAAFSTTDGRFSVHKVSSGEATELHASSQPIVPRGMSPDQRLIALQDSTRHDDFERPQTRVLSLDDEQARDRAVTVLDHGPGREVVSIGLALPAPPEGELGNRWDVRCYRMLVKTNRAGRVVAGFDDGANTRLCELGPATQSVPRIPTPDGTIDDFGIAPDGTVEYLPDSGLGACPRIRVGDEPLPPVVEELLARGSQIAVPVYRGSRGNGNRWRDANYGHSGWWRSRMSRPSSSTSRPHLMSIRAASPGLAVRTVDTFSYWSPVNIRICCQP
jgi:hypothetical protein